MNNKFKNHITNFTQLATMTLCLKLKITLKGSWVQT